MAYYELKIFVDSTDEELLKLYEVAGDKHNSLFFDRTVEDSDKYFDAGFDLFCPEEITLSSGSLGQKIDHRVKCSMSMFTKNSDIYNVGYYLYPRSSTGTKTPLRLSNSVGIIDSGYRGNITAVFDNINRLDAAAHTVEKYQRLVQICPPNLSFPFVVTIVSELSSDTARGSGGFGSTGK